ncbi:MAG: hypothetical protein ACRDSK_27085 [Actinophytocola sp.]|uniref:hypothetical protein n=1 Tax=Actinophytocola sp. TaxID=1872138 RepID=UPI003D6B4F81
MSEAPELAGRVTRLEHEMAEVRFLATKAEKDASDCKTVLIGHTGVLNAIREDQVEQGKKFAKLDTRLSRLEDEVHRGFAEMHQGFAETGSGFATLAAGQAQITALLTAHIEDCGGSAGD